MRSRAAQSGAMAVDEPSSPPDQSSSSNLPQLKFRDTLSWTAGRPIAVGDLLRRLEALSKELRSLKQGYIDRNSLLTVASELSDPKLLTHKDKGVRAWTAAALVDILKLCAPEAPYTAPQLKNIFTLFIHSIIKHLGDSSNPYHSQHVYVLRSLADVKSISLLADIPSSGDLLQDLFTMCFDIVSDTASGPASRLDFDMTGLLSVLVDECPALPPSVVDIVLSQYMRADATTALGMGSRAAPTLPHESSHDAGNTQGQQQLPPAYNMARNICNTCADRMDRYVAQYFSNVIMDASTTHDRETPKKARGRATSASEAADAEDPDSYGPSEADLRELRKAHKLLRELWRASPEITTNVIPQLDIELSTENTQVRILATETIGDLISGIGAAGPPRLVPPDTAAYPPLKLRTATADLQFPDEFTRPISSKPFSQAHPSTFHNWLSRRNDKAPAIRAAWTLSIGWMLATRSGGTGLSSQEEEDAVQYLTRMLVDTDEKVRLVAVKAVGLFSFNDAITRFGLSHEANPSDSLISNLVDRVKDTKPLVRSEAAMLLGNLWGVAHGEIISGDPDVERILGQIPSRILEAVYVNNLEINGLVDRVIFEALLPLSYPPAKGKGKRVNGSTSDLTIDEADKIRTQRLLALVKGLDQKAKTVFFAMLSRPTQMAGYLDAFLQRAEQFNGGVIDRKDTTAKDNLNKIVDYLARTFPEPQRCAEDLFKFAKLHDRRSYQLIRFCKAPDSDFRKIHKSMKELLKRIDSNSQSTATMSETLTTLVYRYSNLFYNKSHVPAIIQFSQSNANELGPPAHEILKEISTKCPVVFKAHVEELCRLLEAQAPASSAGTEQGTVDALKACAGFARVFPAEIPKERKFLQAMVQYALRSSIPQAAKHAVTIIMMSADKKEMYAKDLVKACTKKFEYGSPDFLAKLASLSQVVLFASDISEGDLDLIVDIAINQILTPVRTRGAGDDEEWSEDLDEECTAKIWALRILVNRLRSGEEVDPDAEMTQRVYQLLNTLIRRKGQLSKTEKATNSQGNQLRLHAALLLLKLSKKKGTDVALSPAAFNGLATVAQDACFPVRDRFLGKLKKDLGLDRLPLRFLAIPFLVAFEPVPKLKHDTATWIRARTMAIQRAKAPQPIMEMTFARLISLLAHHPDFSDIEEDWSDLVQYIMFFLKNVATESNISLIYHIAQRVKSVQDAIDVEKSEKLYALSDLAQAIIRIYDDAQNWSMQAYAGKSRLPSGIFAALPSHEVAQQIATKQYLSAEIVDQLEDLVRSLLKTKKRRIDDDAGNVAKRRTTGARHKSLAIRKSPAAKRTPKTNKNRDAEDEPMSERRRSGRSAAQKSYTEMTDSDDDAALEP